LLHILCDGRAGSVQDKPNGNAEMIARKRFVEDAVGQSVAGCAEKSRLQDVSQKQTPNHDAEDAAGEQQRRVPDQMLQ
jgi:hypothetical protein